MQGSDTEQMTHGVEEWIAALLKGDVDALCEMTAEEFVTIGPRGFVFHKQQKLGSLQSGDLKHNSLARDGISIANDGETAMITGNNTHTVRQQDRTRISSPAWWCSKPSWGQFKRA
jgi:hypothetical protein